MDIIRVKAVKIIDNDKKELENKAVETPAVVKENQILQQRFDPTTGAPIYPQAQANNAVSYDPITGAPIYVQPAQNQQVQNQPAGYNPQTGAPIYVQTIMSTAQQYDPHTGEMVYAQPVMSPAQYYDPQTGAPVYQPVSQPVLQQAPPQAPQPTQPLDGHVFSQQPTQAPVIEQAPVISEPVYDNEPRSIEQWPEVFDDKIDAEQEAAELAKKESEAAEKAAEKATKKGKKKRKKGSEEVETQGEEKEDKPQLTAKEKTLEDLQKFIGSAFLAVLAIWVCFTFVFGVFVMSGESMYPKINDGDLVLYYRLSSEYYIDDVVTFELNDTRYTARYIAMAGDVVDITSDGQLKINGSIQSEEIFYATYDLDTGITYPYTVPDGCVFVLCDYRTSSVDSRVFGAVSLDDIDGKVITILRRRSI
ncbi:MAG: signal peptidase I [Clostridia bacterium]